MDEIAFRNWMTQKRYKNKVIGDCISRLKRIEREFGYCDIDVQYQRDRCEYLIYLFSNMGKNEEMKKYSSANFPVGKYHMSTYRYALRRYVQFCDEITSE